MQRHDLAKRFEEAHEELIEPLFRFFYFRLSDRERAKELAQETFLRAWDYARSGREIRALKPFLYTTAGNLYKNELRGRREVVSLELLTEAGVFELESEETSAEELAEAKLLMEKVPELPDSYKEVLLLRYADGLSNKEIAEALDKSEGAVAVQLHRALEKLRELHEPNE